MRLLFVMLDGENFTVGPTINMTRLLPVLAERGYDVQVLCFYLKTHPYADYLQSKKVQCHFNPWTIMSYKAVPWILKKVEEINPDVFIPDVSTQGLIAGKWIKRSGIKVINTLRGNDKLNWGKAIFFSQPSPWQSSAIVCVSKYLEDELKEKLNLEIPSTIIPSGVILSNTKTSQLSKKIKILYSGRLANQQKNISLVLDLFIKLSNADERLEFNFIGSGTEKENMLSVIKKAGLEETIKLYSPLNNEDYKSFLAQNQIIVLLSDHEGTPGAIMDGMSCGLIPIVFKIVGIEKLVIDGVTGFIVDDKENEPFEKILKIIDNLELREILSLNARSHIKNFYSIDYCADQWELLFKKLNLESRLPFKKPIFYKLPKKNKFLLEHITVPLDKIFKYKFKMFLRNL